MDNPADGTSSSNADQVTFKRINITDLGAFRSDVLKRVAKIKKNSTTAKNDPIGKLINEINKIIGDLHLAHNSLEKGCSTYVIRKMIADGEELEKKCREFYQAHFHILAKIFEVVDKYSFPDSLFY